MEARDRLEEELSESRQALEAAQQKHDQLAADLEQAASASASGRPEDTARIAQLSDQVQFAALPLCLCLMFKAHVHAVLPCLA